MDPFAYLRLLSAAPDADPQSLRRELMAIQTGWVRKKDGRLEPFSTEKLVGGIRKSAFKRGTIPLEEAETFAGEIADFVRSRTEPVQSEKLGIRVLQWLKGKDEVAFMSFLFAFKPTESPGTLVRELEEEWGISGDGERR